MAVNFYPPGEALSPWGVGLPLGDPRLQQGGGAAPGLTPDPNDPYAALGIPTNGGNGTGGGSGGGLPFSGGSSPTIPNLPVTSGLGGSTPGLAIDPMTGKLITSSGMSFNDIINSLKTGSSILGATQQGKAQGALLQAGAQQGQDRNAIADYQAQQEAQNAAGLLDLERQKYTTANRGTTAKQALIGALLAGYKPTTLPGIRPAGGGFAGTLLSSPEAKTAMSTLNTQATQAQNTPVTFQGGQLVKPPTLTPLPNLGGANSALSNASTMGQIAGSLPPSFWKMIAGWF